MDLLIFKEGDILDVVLIRQAVEVVQLTVSIWSDKHDRIVIGELVRAILQDEPMKMRRLADIFHVDVASINSMWIISGDTAEDREKLPDILEAVLRDTRAYSETAIADIYEGEMVLFMIGPGNMQDVRALTEAVGNGLAARHIHATLTRCHALNTTTRVREAFLSHQVALSAAKRIFPGQWAYTLEQIDFARECQELIGRGERATEEALRCVAALHHGDDCLLETLEHYLLDARDACDADGGDDVSAQKHHQIPSPAHCGTPGLCSRRTSREHTAADCLRAQPAPAQKLIPRHGSLLCGSLCPFGQMGAAFFLLCG